MHGHDDMTSNRDAQSASVDACANCAALTPRREFVRTLAASAVSALVALGASPAVARAIELRLDEPGERVGDEASYPLPTADSVTIDRENAVIVTRYKNALYAFALSCPHQNTALRWLSADGVFQCPKHKSRYQPDGAFIEGRATRGMDRYALRRDGSRIIVDLTRVFEQGKDSAGWTSAQLSLT
jgi:nitrite reductase/ring-hydroxylating ferredoxin subunit